MAWSTSALASETSASVAGEEGKDELDPGLDATEGLTARTRWGEPGVDLDRTSAPSCPKRGSGRRAFLVGRLGHATGCPTQASVISYASRGERITTAVSWERRAA
jgi:hypothetical protein